MLPVLFKVGPITVSTYGAAMAAAFIIAFFLIRHEAKRKGFSSDLAYDVVILAMIGGIIGARAAFVIDNWAEFARDPIQIFAINQGGQIFYGGLIGGALAVLGYMRLKGLALGHVADIIAPSLALGSAIGRLGCLSAGCCYGKGTTLPWGITFTDERSFASPLGVPLHPTQLYEFSYNMAIFALLWWARPRLKSDGLLFWMYIALYGMSRFVVEFFRTNPVFFLGMSASQTFSLAMLATALTVIFGYYFRSGQSKTEQTKG